jgi:hypothetical protein
LTRLRAVHVVLVAIRVDGETGLDYIFVLFNIFRWVDLRAWGCSLKGFFRGLCGKALTRPVRAAVLVAIRIDDETGLD